MVFKNRCVLVLWTKIASALGGLKRNNFSLKKNQPYNALADHFTPIQDYYATLSVMNHMIGSMLI